MRMFVLAMTITACLYPISQAAPPQPIAADAVDFFQAREAGELDAKFIAANEKRGHLLLKNNGRQPLAIRMPAAFAGVPVLAQFQPFQPVQPNPWIDGNTPQGVAFPGPGLFNQPIQNGVFNVAPERIVELGAGQKRTIRIESVCLDHGRPTPHARMKYDVLPLADYNSSSKLAELIDVFGEGQYSQQAVQALAWHYANGKTIDELRKLRDPKTRTMVFSKKQIDEATRLQTAVEKRMEAKPKSSSPHPQRVESAATR